MTGEQRKLILSHLERIKIFYGEIRRDNRFEIIIEDFANGGHPVYVLEKVRGMRINIDGLAEVLGNLHEDLLNILGANNDE